MLINVKTSSKTMDPWDAARQIFMVEEAKKRADAVHAYELEAGRQCSRPPPQELTHYLVPWEKVSAFRTLQQMETGTSITTGGKENVVHSVEGEFFS